MINNKSILNYIMMKPQDVKEGEKHLSHQQRENTVLLLKEITNYTVADFCSTITHPREQQMNILQVRILQRK
jgi:hypothetical protein